MATKRLSKAAQAKRDAAIDAQREADFQAFEAFRDKFTGLVFKAEVIWFDGTEGMIRGLNGEGRWPLYACNIAGKRTWFPETACVTHEAGQVIDAELKVFYGSGAIAVSHTQGTFDAEKWNRLDHDKLAFRCNEAGEAVTGLFAEGASL